MTISNPFLRSLNLLSSCNCKYCAIGGFAVVMYGIQRFTPDINLVIEPGEENIESLFAAISKAQFDVIGGASLSDAKKQVKEGVASSSEVGNVAFQDPQAPGFQLQIMWGLPLSYNEVSADCKIFEEAGTKFFVTNPEKLALLKSKSPRAQDIYEAGVLAALYDLKIEIPGLDKLNAEDSIQQDLENFSGFKDEPTANKLEWLQLVLTQLGSFCVV